MRLLKFGEVLAFRVPCDYLIITNDGTRGDDCAAVLGVPKERLRFRRNGVNKAMYDPVFDPGAFKESLSIPRDDNLVLTLCGLIGWKGVGRLITALPAVLPCCPNTTAVIVDDGEDRGALEALCRDLKVADSVRFAGVVAHEDAPRFLNGADIFLSLYRYGNVGNPLLEAMCHGRCVVFLNNGGTGKLVSNGHRGVLLEEGQLDQLSEVLTALLQDDQRRTRLGRAAPGYAQRELYTWPERIRMEVELVERLVACRRRDVPGDVPVDAENARTGWRA